MKNTIEEIKTEIEILYKEGLEIIENEKKVKVYIASESISISYNSWYSKSLPLIKFVLPDRYEEFRSYFLPDKGRKKLLSENFKILDFISRTEEYDSINVLYYNPQFAFISLFQVQIGIVYSCLNRLESKFNDFKNLIQAELFDYELESARHLLSSKFYRASGVIAGIVLENHLKNVCQNRNIELPKNPTISKFLELLKNENVIDTLQWRNISYFGDIRNLCSHSKDREPTKEECEELIKGVEKIIKTIY